MLVAVYVAPLKLTVAGLNAAWSSAGTPDAARLTGPMNGPRDQVTFMGTETVEQGGTLTSPGESIVYGGNTFSPAIVECALPPALDESGVPIMVILTDIRGALAAAVTVIVVVEPVAGLGLNETWTPAGRADVLMVMPPLEPLSRLMSTTRLFE